MNISAALPFPPLLFLPPVPAAIWLHGRYHSTTAVLAELMRSDFGGSPGKKVRWIFPLH